MTTTTTTYMVTGTVTSPDRAGLGSLIVQVVDKNVGPDVLLAETTIDGSGSYNTSFTAQSLLSRNKTQPDLQARVYAGQTFLAASDVQYNATTNETLNVNLPANLAALPSEYETLTGALAAHYTGQLNALQETSDRQDITYLANKTGWDARAVALAALADQFSQITAPAPTPTPAPAPSRKPNQRHLPLSAFSQSSITRCSGPVFRPTRTASSRPARRRSRRSGSRRSRRVSSRRHSPLPCPLPCRASRS